LMTSPSPPNSSRVNAFNDSGRFRVSVSTPLERSLSNTPMPPPLCCQPRRDGALRYRRSPTFPLRRAALEEGPNPFIPIFGAKEQVEVVSLIGEAGLQRRVLCLEHGVLGEPHRHRCFGGHG